MFAASATISHAAGTATPQVKLVDGPPDKKPIVLKSIYVEKIPHKS